jgi:hypothetical protein
LFLAASFTSAKWAFVGSQPMLLALSKPVRIDLGENLVGLPAFAGRPAGGHWRIDRLHLDAAPIAVLDEFPPKGSAAFGFG